jgi:hypothetical protein
MQQPSSPAPVLLPPESSRPPPFHPSSRPTPTSSPCLSLMAPAARQLPSAWLRCVGYTRGRTQAVANDGQTCFSRTRVKLSTYAPIYAVPKGRNANVSPGRTVPRNRIAVHFRQSGHRAMHWSLRRGFGMVWHPIWKMHCGSDMTTGESGRPVSLSSEEVSRRPGYERRT